VTYFHSLFHVFQVFLASYTSVCFVVSAFYSGMCDLLLQLKTIECMDVAEQSLHALEILSHKHSKVILQAVILYFSANSCLVSM